MEIEDFAADAALFARMRAVWEEVDPVPADLVDRMVAAVAVEDLSREYALLTLVEGSTLAAVRGETDTATLQFSDGTTSVLLHVTATEDGSRRVDGWVDAAALAIRLSPGRPRLAAEAGEHGRFAFDIDPRRGLAAPHRRARRRRRPARIPDTAVRSVGRVRPEKDTNPPRRHRRGGERGSGMADNATWRERESAAAPRGVQIDPLREPVRGVRAYSSTYAPGHLLITGDPGPALGELEKAAGTFGWVIDRQTLAGNR